MFISLASGPQGNETESEGKRARNKRKLIEKSLKMAYPRDAAKVDPTKREKD